MQSSILHVRPVLASVIQVLVGRSLLHKVTESGRHVCSPANASLVGNVCPWCCSATDSTCGLVCVVSTNGWLARSEKRIHVTQSMSVAVPNIAVCIVCV